MLDKLMCGAAVLAFFMYARKVWRSRYRGLPRRFRCLHCGKLYRSIESEALLEMVFCSKGCEDIHQATGR